MKHLPRTAFLLLSALSLGLSGCGSASDDPFIAEYEALNGETTSSGKQYLDMTIDRDHRFVNATEDQIRALLTDGDGVIYFGFPECPWCRNAVPAINEAAMQVNLDQVLYLNVREIRDQKVLDDDGEVVVEQEGTDFYYYLLKKLGDFAPEYSGLEDPTERRILVPLVVVVVGGNVVSSHLGTVDSQEDPYVAMTDEQFDELVAIYSDAFSLVPGCGENYCE